MAGNQQEDEHEAALSDGDRSRASDSHEAQPGQKLQAKWDEMYGRLVAFQEREGHCLVPNRYHKDPQLGSWGKDDEFKSLLQGTNCLSNVFSLNSAASL